MRLLIEVAEHHIADGVQKSASRCPVARALRDKGFELATATERELYALTIEGAQLYAETPALASEFITQFDADRRAVEPISFYCTFERGDAT